MLLLITIVSIDVGTLILASLGLNAQVASSKMMSYLSDEKISMVSIEGRSKTENTCLESIDRIFRKTVDM
jgi:hypothetical protein